MKITIKTNIYTSRAYTILYLNTYDNLKQLLKNKTYTFLTTGN